MEKLLGLAGFNRESSQTFKKQTISILLLQNQENNSQFTYKAPWHQTDTARKGFLMSMGAG